MSIQQQPLVRKGRGAIYNPPNRYYATQSVAMDDGWWLDEVPQKLATTIREEPAKTALSWNHSPDLGFDRSINPYRGCEHGCIYCYARPTHAYWDMSPGIEFETQLIARTGMADRLREELCKPGYRCRPINLSGNTDCYQPIEAERRETRAILKLLLECHHPVTIVTKSTLVLRDMDILEAMAERDLVQVSISLTTLDDELKHRMEPRAASPRARLRTISELSRTGIPVSVLTSPVIPGLNDHELEDLLQSAADVGAQNAAWLLLRLPREVAPLFENWLHQHYPDRAHKIMSLIRQCRGGANYDSRFGKRMTGEGVFAQLLAKRFDNTCQRLGLNQRHRSRLNCSSFRAPNGQGHLFL